MSASEPNLTVRSSTTTGTNENNDESNNAEPQGLLETFAAMARRRGPTHPPQQNIQQQNNVGSHLFPRFAM